MFYLFIYLFIVISILIILFIVSQPTKQLDSLSLLNNNQQDVLFKIQKNKGAGYILNCIIAGLVSIWILFGILLMYFSYH